MLDKALEEAMTMIVREARQPDAVAKRLTAWLMEMSKRQLEDEDTSWFLENVCNALELEVDDAD